MSTLKTTVKFQTKKVSLKNLTPEQRITVVNLANSTGRDINDIIKEVLADVKK